jgi:hypothetical protein
MKARHKRIRVFRRLAIAGCLAGLAVPTTAGAMLPTDVPYHPAAAQSQQPYSPPAQFRTEVQTPNLPYSPPARFRTEVQTPNRAPVEKSTFQLRRTFHPEVQTQPSPASSTSSPTVIRQIETVSSDSGRTLAVVLASIALAIALCGLAYTTIRVAKVQRRELGSGH